MHSVIIDQVTRRQRRSIGSLSGQSRVIHLSRLVVNGSNLVRLHKTSTCNKPSTDLVAIETHGKMPVALTAASLRPFTIGSATTGRPLRPDEIANPSQHDKLLDVQTPRNTIKVLRTSHYVNFVTPPTTGESIREDLVLTGLVVINLDSTKLTEKLILRFIVELDVVDSRECFR